MKVIEMPRTILDQTNAMSIIAAKERRGGDLSIIERSKIYPYYGYIDINVPIDHEIVLFSNNDDYVAIEYFWTGAYEPMSLSLWARLCTLMPPLILDIGAYTGLFGLVAAKISPKSQVICIEPIDRIYSRIMINQKINQVRNLQIVKGVASNRSEFARLSISVGIGILPTGTSIRTEEGPSTIETFDVQTHVVDELLRRHPGRRCGLMKIDAERHEVEVLLGSRTTIEQWRPDILIEVLDSEIYKGVRSFIDEVGLDYRWYSIDDVNLNVCGTNEATLTNGSGRNFLLTARPAGEVEIDIQHARKALRGRIRRFN